MIAVPLPLSYVNDGWGRRNEATFGYGNVMGMHAYGLVETGSYAKAEEAADMAINHSRTKDVWAMHAMAHVYEMEVRKRRRFESVLHAACSRRSLDLTLSMEFHFFHFF